MVEKHHAPVLRSEGLGELAGAGPRSSSAGGGRPGNGASLVDLFVRFFGTSSESRFGVDPERTAERARRARSNTRSSADLGWYEAPVGARREPTVDLASRGQSSTAMYRLDRATKQSYQVESSALRTDRARAERPKSIGPHNFRFQTEDLLGHR